MNVKEFFNDGRFAAHNLANQVDTTVQRLLSEPPRHNRAEAYKWLAVSQVPEVDLGPITGSEADELRRTVGAAIFHRHSATAADHASAIRDQVAAIVELHPGAAISHVAQDLQRAFDPRQRVESRAGIIAGMFDVHNASSALSLVIKHEIDTALKNLARQLKTVEAETGQAPSVSEAQALAAQATACASPLAQLRLESEFALRLVDAYMRPRPEVARQHAEILLAEARPLRAGISSLVHDVLAGTLPSPDDFGKKLDRLLHASSRNILRQMRTGTVGLASDQQRVMDHMSQTFTANIEHSGAVLSAAMGPLGLLNGLIPAPSQGLARAGLGVARSVLGFAAQAAISGEAVGVKANARGERRYQDPFLPPPNFSVLGKRLLIASSKEISNIMRSAGFDEHRMETVLAPMIEAGVARLRYTRGLFPDTGAASAFMAAHAGYFDALVALKDLLSKQHDTLQASTVGDAGQNPALEATRQQLATLTGIGPNLGIAQRSDNEKFTALVSYLQRSGATAGADLGRLVRNAAEIVRDPGQRGVALASNHSAASAWDGEQVHSEAAVARQIGLESEAFCQLADDLNQAFFQGHRADLATAANTTMILAGAAAGMVANVVTAVPAAAAAAAAGPAGAALATALTQLVLAPAISAPARWVAHAVTQRKMEQAAAGSHMATQANPVSPLPSAAELTDTIIKSRPNLVALNRQGLDTVVRSHAQDALADIAKSQFVIGRMNLAAMLARGPDAKSHLKALMTFEDANAVLSAAQQGQADVAPDVARIAAHRDLIAKARAYAGQSGAVAAPLASLNAVQKTEKEVAIHQVRIAAAQPELERSGAQLLDQLSQGLEQLGKGSPKLRLTEQDWRNVKAFFLYPYASAELADKLTTMEGRLLLGGTLLPREARDVAGNFSKRVSALYGTTGNEAEFKSARGRYQDRLARRQDTVRALVDDHRQYTQGNTGAVQDHGKIYQRWLHDYGSAQIQLRRALTPNGATAVEVGAKLVAGAAQLPLAAAAGLAPVAIGATGAMRVPGVGKVNPFSAVSGAVLGAINPGALAPRSLAGDNATSVNSFDAGFRRCSFDFGAADLGLSELDDVLGKHLLSEFKRDPKHGLGVAQHPRAGFPSRPIGLEAVAGDVRRIERPGKVSRVFGQVGKAMAPVRVVRAMVSSLQRSAPRQAAAVHAMLSLQGEDERKVEAGIHKGAAAAEADAAPSAPVANPA
jgi:hypothetical protein